MIVSFGSYELDLTNFELRSDEAVVALQPRTFDVLAYLITNADRVVTKTELLDHVWGTQFVTESTLATAIKFARQALDDDGQRQQAIKTVHGRGYRFVAPIDHIDGVQRVEQPAGAASSPLRTVLPIDRTPLLGRGESVAAVGETLESNRLVTLLGIGGVGKTRLAIAAARRFEERFSDGVVYVDLVPTIDEATIDLTIAEAAGVGVTDTADVRRRIGDVVGDRQLLFVLDNAEHVAADLAAVVDELLETTRVPRFMVTSRVPLGLVDECRYLVEPLPTPPEDAGQEPIGDNPAASLLSSTAQRLGATLTEADDAAIAQICRRLDGLPLAIELAAGQLRQLSASSLATRLDRRFDVLTDRPRRTGRRHSSLQAVLTDTWESLDDPSRSMLTQMAAFPTSFSLDDLVEVVGDSGSIEGSLGELVDHSLVVRETADSYRLLETIRLFATRRATGDQLRACADRHAAWCLGRVGQNVRESVVEFRTADWCISHGADVRAAYRHLDLTDRPDDAARLLAGTALAMHLDTGAQAANVEDLLSMSTVADPALAAWMHVTGVMCAMATRSPELIAQHGARAVAAADEAGDPTTRCVALVLRSWSEVFVDPDAAIDMTTTAAGLADGVAELRLRDLADTYRAYHLAVRREFDAAVEVAQSVVDRSPLEAGKSYPTYAAVAALASLTAIREPERARSAADALKDLPSPERTMWANDLVRAAVYAANEDAERASELADGIVERLARAGYDPMPDLLIPPAILAHRRGDDDRAARWLDAIRHAGRPTQSFQVTILYRCLRRDIADPASRAVTDEPLEEVGRQALAWLREGGRS